MIPLPFETPVPVHVTSSTNKETAKGGTQNVQTRLCRSALQVVLIPSSPCLGVKARENRAKSEASTEMTNCQNAGGRGRGEEGGGATTALIDLHKAVVTCHGFRQWPAGLGTEGHTLRASLSGTLLQTLPDLVTPLKGHSLSPRSGCPRTRSTASERFGY